MTPGPEFHLFSHLSVELRLKIWSHALDLQEPRVVEICTVPHENCSSYQGFCPRFSPSPAPLLVNICHESRQVALERATTEIHLFFSTPSASSGIIFNPDVDTLYVPDEKDHWIRGPDGVMTQLKTELDPDRIRFLAADLNPYGLQEGALKADMDAFQRLKQYVLVVQELKDGDWERFKGAERSLQQMKGLWERRIQRNYTRVTQREFVDGLSLAIYRGGRLTLIEEGH